MKRVSPLLFAALFSFAMPTPAVANTEDQARRDAALADEIERLTRRDTDGLVPRTRPDGSVELDLQGRFRQVIVGRTVDDTETMIGCVGSLEEAQGFFGRDLRTGKALTATWPAPDSLAARATRLGMTPMQLRFYESLIDKAPSVDQGKAATITIRNDDGPGEGFNDPTPATPEGGNTGTTRGQQRLILFNQAAAIWGAFLDSPVPIVVAAEFEPLTCDATRAVLGAAGPNALVREDSGIVPEPTVFPVALYNKLTGIDDNGTDPEIFAFFNSSIDDACQGPGRRFYYGLDNASPAGTVNFLVVLLHEMAHGLGFLSFTRQNGTFPLEAPDIWSRFQFDRSTGLLWSQMTDAERAASAINPNNVLWNGPNVRVASGFLTAARDTDGRVELFTPNPYRAGGSVGHWNATATPNLLMEPSINIGLPLTLDLTRQLMRDIGWFRDSDNNGTPDTITNVQPSGTSIFTGSLTTITWLNNGGFNRNVDIELSNDGGATFPTVIASNVANTGSFSWLSPSTPITQGRIRVRESGFVQPGGVSASNFTNGNTPPTFTPAAAVTRQQGTPAGAAVAIGTVADSNTPAGSLTVTEFIGGTATGITVGGITNTNGAVTATLAASCTATAGTVRFRVNDGIALSNGFGELQVNVNANTPPTLTYAAQSANLGGSLSVTPSTGLGDNGIVTASLVSQSTYTGGITVNANNGVVSLTNLAPAGVHTITVRATDNCNVTRDATFQLTVVNTPPVLVPGPMIVRQQGSPPGIALVGTVSGGQTPAGNLVVTQIAGGTATGITATGLTNNNGTVTAQIAASCDASPGFLRFQVSDGNATAFEELDVNVNSNVQPNISYIAQSTVSGGGSLTINPSSLSDNGTVVSTVVQSLGTYTGTITVGATNGVISLSNAGPVGSHTITIRATDNCGETRDATFQLNVTAPVNTPPTFTPAAAISRQQGSPAGVPIAVGTVADAQTPAGNLVVTRVGGTSFGINVGGITNTNGAVTATVGATCLATSGTVRFEISDGSSVGVGNVQVNVVANTPPTLSYVAQSAFLGASLTVNPGTGPVDNGVITGTALLSQGTYTGTISVANDGVVSLSNIAPVGVHTITVRTTDDCGATRDASFQLSVSSGNTAPSFSPVPAITRQQGSPAAGATAIGTVGDVQTPVSALTVTPISGGTATGITVTGISNSLGSISAVLTASCTATAGTVRFQVSDGSLTGTGDLQVNVTANTPPTLTYAAQSGVAGAALTVNPATGPSDTGVINTIALLSQGTYTGTISVGNANGVVSLSNLAPVGTHTITVRATDNCGATRDASFQLTVGAANTAPTFTPVAPLTRRQGEPEGAAITIGTVTDAQTPAGNLTVAFTGGTALGVAIGGLTNTNGTVTASVRALCNATTGTLRFQVSDGTLTSTGDLQVNVLPNTPPALTYGAQFVAAGGTLAVTPATGPTDNGPATTTALLNAGTYTGTVSVGASNGVVSLSNAAPVGLHTLTVRATDNCGATTDAPVSVQVNGDAVFGSGFEPVTAAND